MTEKVRWWAEWEELPPYSSLLSILPHPAPLKLPQAGMKCPAHTSGQMGPSGISFGSDFAAGTDSVTGLDSGMMSVAGNGWLSRSAVGSCSLSAVGKVAGSVSGVMMDGTWGWMLAAGTNSQFNEFNEFFHILLQVSTSMKHKICGSVGSVVVLN